MKNIATESVTANLKCSDKISLGAKLHKLKRYIPFYVMFTPVLIYYLIFCYAPMAGVIIAFKNYTLMDGVFGSGWVGFAHFQRFYQTGDFWLVLRNTIVISFLRILFGFPAPIIFALLLSELKFGRLKRFIQTATYLPHFISWVVVYGILYNFLSGDGVVNQIAAFFGRETTPYMSSEKYFSAIYVGSAIWKEMGWSAIIYIAALAGVDIQLYEAAKIDGAGRWQQMWHITLPSIRSVISIMFVLGLGNVLNVGFEQILVMYNSTVAQVADVFDYYIYRIGLQTVNSYSYATAVGLFRSVVSLILVLITNWGAKKIDEEGSIW